ncbi:hypothetical protein [Paenibacillus sp. MBLB4367]|uniref:hypothetical protein n=1 Tax=Paenibacillus sp. MBLB4367 TaxID=3384767 RepID=UPI0039082873
MRQSVKQKIVIDCANRLQSSGFQEAIASEPLLGEADLTMSGSMHADQWRFVPRKTPR